MKSVCLVHFGVILTVSCLSSGHLDMVRFLLEAGADQEHKTDEMHTALMEACMVTQAFMYTVL